MKNPNRLVAVALAVCGFAAAVLPVAANLDWTSTAGVLGGLGAVAAAAVTWLLGWQKWEASQLAGSASAVQAVGAVTDDPPPLNATPTPPVGN